MTAKRYGLAGMVPWLMAGACVVAFAASSQAKPPRRAAATTLDDRLYELALSSSTPKDPIGT